MPTFSHSLNTWACISSSFIFQEHEKVAWPVMTTAQLVRVVTSCSHMAQVHLQKHLISCQVPEHNLKYNLEPLWTEGFKFNAFLCSRFLMLKQGDSRYTNKGIIRVTFKIRWPHVQYKTHPLRRWGCNFSSTLFNYSTGEMLGGGLCKKSKRQPKLQTFQDCCLNWGSCVVGFSEFFCFTSVNSISLVIILK